MDLLVVILIAVAAFVAFVLLTAYFMKATLYVNSESDEAKEKIDSEEDYVKTAEKTHSPK